MTAAGRAVFSCVLAAAVSSVAAASPPSSPVQLDSQLVLQRYALAVEAVLPPKNVVFTYAVSQLGPSNIEQRHRIYRSGADVRDETLAVDGVALTRKSVRVSRREDRYAIARLAPRTGAYQMLFLRPVKDGDHLDYVYEATPIVRQSGPAIDGVTIDGLRFLPRLVHFRTVAGDAAGTGEVRYAPFGPYWMPVSATVAARVGGKPAREHISWGDYRFPESLPASTFAARRTLPSESP